MDGLFLVLGLVIVIALATLAGRDSRETGTAGAAAPRPNVWW